MTEHVLAAIGGLVFCVLLFCAYSIGKASVPVPAPPAPFAIQCANGQVFYTNGKIIPPMHLEGVTCRDKSHNAVILEWAP